MNDIKIILFFFIGSVSWGQVNNSSAIDTRYLEDQLYIGITYNTLYELPTGIDQNGFSNGISFGFIKDIPVNDQRNVGFGLGLGYGRNTYFQNLKIFEEEGILQFEEVNNFDKNKFSLHTIEIPFEFRWRSSTINKYKFWRIYTGVKLGYVIASNAKLKKGGTLKVRGIDAIEKFQYGLTLGAGYGTWNFNIYYGLNDMFSSEATLNRTGAPITAKDIRIGLIFYIL